MPNLHFTLRARSRISSSRTLAGSAALLLGALGLLLQAAPAQAGARVLTPARKAKLVAEVLARATAAAPVVTSAPAPAPIASVAPPELPSQPAAVAPVLTMPIQAPGSATSGSPDPAAIRDSEISEFAQAQASGTGVWLTPSLGMLHRSLDFSQDVYHRMREVGANLYVYRLDAEFYPSFQLPALAGQIGFVASYEGAAAGSVKDADYNGTYPLTHSEVYGGVRIRHATPRYVIGADVLVGQLSSGLDDHGAAHTPDVSYTEVRSSLDATFQLPRGVRLRGSAGFRVPVAYGQMSDADWFPHVGGYGFDVGVDAEYPLSRNVAVTARTSLRRYVLEMNSQPEDASGGIAETAGGAVDSYLGGYLGVIVGL